jgi:serine/threonine-protein kinase
VAETLAGLARLSQLLDELLDMPAAERPGWLEALGPADAPFRARLLNLLGELRATENETTGFALAAPRSALQQLLHSLPAMAEEAALQGPSRRIGPYRLISPLGRGGMGTVWLAERVDGALQRRVALKLPHLNTLDPVFADRFERERDILAALEHPHIARLYDAGVTAEGQPYLALEVVEGVPITTHCAHAGLGLRERIALFLQVLEAVQYAHSRLVVHRDLKPSNILVTAQGQVRLLDFGIAALLDDGQRPADEVQTQWASSPLTPDYASPEQIAGGAIATTSDVYSLGVIFYELLTGQRPYKLAEVMRAALESGGAETEPTKPSRMATASAKPGGHDGLGGSADPGGPRESAPPGKHAAAARQLSRELRGDLDNIALKALRKSPQARYASAEAFEQDLLRWLRHEPVLAHPGSRLYLAAKFIARHRVPVAAGTVAALALVLGTAVAVFQARVAQRESQHARAVQGVLISLFEEADPARAQGREVTVRDLMGSGERKLQMQLESEPELSAALSAVMVSVYGKLGDAKRGLPVAEAWAASALALHGEGSPEQAQALLGVANMQSALGQHERALQTAGRARPVIESQAKSRPEDALALRTVTADSLLALSRNEEARAVLVDLREEQLRRYGARSFQAASTLAKIASSLAEQGKHREAAQALRELEPALEQRWPEEGMGNGTLRANVGYAEWQVRRWPEAERSLLASIAEIDRLVGPNNSQSIEAGRTLGMVYFDSGQFAKASASFGQNLERSRQFFGPQESETALNLSFHAMALTRNGDTTLAEAEARESVRMAQGQTTLSASEVRGLQRRLAYALVLAGKPAEALKVVGALLAQENAAGLDDTRHAISLGIEAGAYTALGRPREAAAAAAESARVWRQAGAALGAAGQIGVAKAHLTEALAWLAAAEPARAQAPLDSALGLLRAAHAQPHADLAQADMVRARWLLATGHRAEGEKLALEARERFERLSGSPAPKTLLLPL